MSHSFVPQSADRLYELGLSHSSGLPLHYDLVEAHKWFSLAAMRGDRRARECRTEIAREMTKAEIGEAQRRARLWLSQY
jgi:uncharacterized protein